jgi:hypothetical protein
LGYDLIGLLRENPDALSPEELANQASRITKGVLATVSVTDRITPDGWKTLLEIVGEGTEDFIRSLPLMSKEEVEERTEAHRVLYERIQEQAKEQLGDDRQLLPLMFERRDAFETGIADYALEEDLSNLAERLKLDELMVTFGTSFFIVQTLLDRANQRGVKGRAFNTMIGPSQRLTEDEKEKLGKAFKELVFSGLVLNVDGI